jgi:hypothetical protein
VPKARDGHGCEAVPKREHFLTVIEDRTESELLACNLPEFLETFEVGG